MIKKPHIFFLLIFASVYSFIIHADEPIDEGINVSDLKIVETTVVSVDLNKNFIVLKDNQNNEYPINVIPEIKDLDKVKVGNKVRLEYKEKFEVYLASPEEKIGASIDSNLSVPNSIQQLTTGIDIYEEVYLITSIDLDKRLVSLKSAEGKTLTMKVEKSVKGFKKLQVNDKIRSVYTRIINVSLIQ